MKQRSFSHDYSQRATYLVTLVIDGRKPLLGTIAGDPAIQHGRLPQGCPKGNVAGRPCGKRKCPYSLVRITCQSLLPGHIDRIEFEKDNPLGVTSLYFDISRRFEVGYRLKQ